MLVDWQVFGGLDRFCNGSRPVQHKNVLDGFPFNVPVGAVRANSGFNGSVRANSKSQTSRGHGSWKINTVQNKLCQPLQLFGWPPSRSSRRLKPRGPIESDDKLKLGRVPSHITRYIYSCDKFSLPNWYSWARLLMVHGPLLRALFPEPFTQRPRQICSELVIQV